MFLVQPHVVGAQKVVHMQPHTIKAKNAQRKNQEHIHCLFTAVFNILNAYMTEEVILLLLDLLYKASFFTLGLQGFQVSASYLYDSSAQARHFCQLL